MQKTTREVVSESQELIDAQNEHDKQFLKPFGVTTGTKIWLGQTDSTRRTWELIEKSLMRRNNG